MKRKKNKKSPKTGAAPKAAASAAEAQAPGKPAKRRKSRLRENIEAILIAVALALFIRAFLVQPFKIPSGSMIPTLEIGDHIFVNKFIYGIRMPFTNNVLIPWSRPQRGDIVVFQYPNDPSIDYIKRVIGIPGDTVEMRDRKLYVNGKPVPDEHAHYTNSLEEDRRQPLLADMGPIQVEENKYFMMGDNRDNSADSRRWGQVDFSALRGKAMIVYYSGGWNLFGADWSRVGRVLH